MFNLPEGLGMRKLSVGFAVSLILAGCGGGGSSNPTSTAPNTNPTTASVPVKDPLKIVTGTAYDPGDAYRDPRWVIGDFNKDGAKDIFLRYTSTAAWSASNTGKAPVKFFLGSNTGGFEESKTIFPEGLSLTLVNRIITSDFNGDGNNDILIAASGQDPYVNGMPAQSGFTGEYVQILTYTPSGFVLSKIANSPLTFAHHASSGDINGDYLPDTYISSLLFSEPFFIMGDSNGNYKADTTRFPKGTFAGQKVILERFANGSPKKWENFNFSSSIVVDANNDGHKDVVGFADAGTKNSVVFLNDGSGHFSADRIINLPVGPYGQGSVNFDSPTSTKSYVTGTLNIDSFAADVNNDGKMDLITLTSKANQTVDNSTSVYFRGASVQILINNGNGFTDESKTRVNFNYSPEVNYTHYDSIEFADINNDKFPDILLHRTQIALDNANPTRILINDGKGNFSEKDYPKSLPIGILTVLGPGHYAILINSKTNVADKYSQRIDDVYYDWSIGQSLFP